MIKKLLVILISIILFGFCSSHALAKNCECVNNSGTKSEKTCDDCASAACDSGYTSCVEKSGSTASVSLPNPLPGITTPQAFIGKLISGILGVVGSLALLMFIYGGLTWMTAAGKSEQVKKGQEILTWATIGLVVIFASYALVRFIFQAVGALPS